MDVVWPPLPHKFGEKKEKLAVVASNFSPYFFKDARSWALSIAILGTCFDSQVDKPHSASWRFVFTANLLVACLCSYHAVTHLTYRHIASPL